MSAPRYPTRLSAREPICWLADAWARSTLHTGNIAFLTKRTSTRILPWAISPKGEFIAELWPTLRKIHRKKRGFSYVAEHLRRMRETIQGLTSRPVGPLEVWEHPVGEPIDEKLLAQWSDIVEWELIPISKGVHAERLKQLSRQPCTEIHGDPNPLLELQGFLTKLDLNLLS
ncbi:MAG: hypothetical protein VX223_09520 [Myxococcota bacterium]|nr:hypothetical protein [Myxococcota bacterium]